MAANKPVIGIIGAGRLGTAIARQAVKAGYVINIGNSRGPLSLELMLSVLLPDAVALAVEELVEKSDMVILAIPLNKYRMLNAELFAGKIVIDAMNYWPPTEGEIPEFMNTSQTSSEYLQAHFRGVRLVKTLNHVAYSEIEEHSLPPRHPKRRAVAVAGDDIEAKEAVEQFIDALGFDAVDVGGLRQGIAFEPDTELFNTRLSKNEIEQVIAKSRQ